MSLYWKRLLLFLLGAAICVAIYVFLLSVSGLSSGSHLGGVISALVLAISTAFLTNRFLRIDSLPVAVLGLASLNRPFGHLILGIVTGSGLAALWWLLATGITGATCHLNSRFNGFELMAACAFHFFNNTAEELVYRGYGFVRLVDRLGPASTVLVTSGVFALLHLQAGLPLLSVIAGVFTSGLIFGAIFERWRSLPLALGFHVATNIVQDLSGLRNSTASVLTLNFPSVDANSGAKILGGVAALNLLVTVGIHFSRRRHSHRS